MKSLWLAMHCVVWLVLGMSLSACQAPAEQPPALYDQAGVDVSIGPAVVSGVITFPGAQLSPEEELRLNARRAFFAQDWPALDRWLNAAHNAHVSGHIPASDVDRFIDDVVDPTHLAGLGPCEHWLKGFPTSYAAHLVCGAVWADGAWVARGQRYTHQTAPIQRVLMRERMSRSNALLERARTLTPKPVEALAIMARNHMALGSRSTAHQLLEQAEHLLPAYVPVHAIRIKFSAPVWNGSVEEVQSAIARAEQAQIDPLELLRFKDNHMGRPERFSNPGDERAYWEQRLAEKVTVHRLSPLAKDFMRLQNWNALIETTTRWIDMAPSSAEAFWMRAVAYEYSGDHPKALVDYRRAAALGDENALQKLIQSHLTGGLQLPSQDWKSLDQICRYGAALGSPSAANCLGGMFWEGDSVGPPFHTDVPQSLAWHLLAARAGHHNSQYDLGWLLFTQRVPGLAAEPSQAAGLFWLRRAAQQGHRFAIQKLNEAEQPLEEEVQLPTTPVAEDWLRLGLRLLRAVF